MPAPLEQLTGLLVDTNAPRKKRRLSVRQRLSEAAALRRYAGREVYVYHNADRGSWSVRVNELEHGRWVERDVCHPDYVLIENARFEVDSIKRQRMFASGRRNQHAGVWGTLVALGEDAVHQAPAGCDTPILYRPMLRGDFHTRAGQSLTGAETVLFDISEPDSSQWVLAAGLSCENGGDYGASLPQTSPAVASASFWKS